MAAAAVGTVAMTAEPAAAILPTTTAVTSSANPALGGAQVTLTATVKILGTNLGPVTPRGTVTFSVDGSPVATAPVGSCLLLLTQCTASTTITTPAYDAEDVFEGNQYTVTANYNGDLLASPSSGSLVQRVTGPRGCNSTFSCTHQESAADGSADLYVEVPGGEDEGLYTITISFTDVAMSCSRPNTGAIGVFDVTLDRIKTVRYDTYNQQAVTANQQPNRICWASDSPFTTASGTPAPLTGSGFYEGLLPACAVDGTLPCVDTTQTEFRPAQGPGCDCDMRARLRTYVIAPAGDPKSGR
jgi:hypothetical protein